MPNFTDELIAFFFGADKIYGSDGFALETPGAFVVTHIKPRLVERWKREYKSSLSFLKPRLQANDEMYDKLKNLPFSQRNLRMMRRYMKETVAIWRELNARGWSELDHKLDDYHTKITEIAGAIGATRADAPTTISTHWLSGIGSSTYLSVSPAARLCQGADGPRPVRQGGHASRPAAIPRPRRLPGRAGADGAPP